MGPVPHESLIAAVEAKDCRVEESRAAGSRTSE